MLLADRAVELVLGALDDGKDIGLLAWRVNDSSHVARLSFHEQLQLVHIAAQEGWFCGTEFVNEVVDLGEFGVRFSSKGAPVGVEISKGLSCLGA